MRGRFCPGGQFPERWERLKPRNVCRRTAKASRPRSEPGGEVVWRRLCVPASGRDGQRACAVSSCSAVLSSIVCRPYSPPCSPFAAQLHCTAPVVPRGVCVLPSSGSEQAGKQHSLASPRRNASHDPDSSPSPNPRRFARTTTHRPPSTAGQRRARASTSRAGCVRTATSPPSP